MARPSAAPAHNKNRRQCVDEAVVLASGPVAVARVVVAALRLVLLLRITGIPLLLLLLLRVHVRVVVAVASAPVASLRALHVVIRGRSVPCGVPDGRIHG